jgi:hypothetical protein
MPDAPIASDPLADDSPSVEVDDGVLDIDESAEILPFRYDITAYGADYPVDGLVKRLQNEDIVVPTFDPELPEGQGGLGFQRGYIWRQSQADRFIESLLLGLPVPGIFLVKQPSGVFLVLDGQQRLRTLQYFYEGILRSREFKLKEVQDSFKGKTYKSLDEEDRRRLDDSIIHATIVRQDIPADDQSSIYLIFERLNSGGTVLKPHEIRVALYPGKFLQMLRDLNMNPSWRALYGPKSKTLKDQELLLRFFALFEWGDEYSAPMKGFLNDYLAAHKDIDAGQEQRLRALFEETVRLIEQHIGPKAFRIRTAINAAVLDSVMVGVARRVNRGNLQHVEELAPRHASLLKDSDYMSAVERATAREENVSLRLRKSRETFDSIA